MKNKILPRCDCEAGQVVQQHSLPLQDVVPEIFPFFRTSRVLVSARGNKTKSAFSCLNTIFG